MPQRNHGPREYVLDLICHDVRSTKGMAAVSWLLHVRAALVFMLACDSYHRFLPRWFKFDV